LDNGKIWNFKEEAKLYCELDCISLYQVLTKFNTLIFNKFKLNINNYPTLPGLSFAIFRAHYLKDNSIHMLSGDISKDIRTGYTGGAVDMYVPKSFDNSKIYAYDVNSLYPYVMRDFKMPIGNPIYFNGNILKKEDKPFGFFYCNITAPDNLEHPIIQSHINTNDGIRTISPQGAWKDMIFSEEMYNAMKLGYKFDVKWGYLFNSDFIFKDFVNDIYELRLKYPKSDPMNYTAKLILNSLYGRFGMDDNFSQSYIMSKIDYKSFENKLNNKESIQDIIDLGGNYLVQIKNPKVELNTQLDNGSEKHNVNVAVASAISAYGRIYMSQFKNDPDYILFNTDTDSIYIDTPLPDSFISETELGKMKLENICSKAIFIAPKVYGIVNEKGEEIIKIKGLTEDSRVNITVDNLEELLVKDNSLEVNQDKWYRNIAEGNISVKEQIYTLKVTGNKRKLIYDKTLQGDNLVDIFVDTEPYIIDENKNIINIE
jgi:hypothetical protein